MNDNKNLRNMNSEESQRLAKMRQAMFKAFSEASKDNNDENSFYDISQGNHFINLVQNKPVITNNVSEFSQKKSHIEMHNEAEKQAPQNLQNHQVLREKQEEIQQDKQEAQRELQNSQEMQEAKEDFNSKFNERSPVEIEISDPRPLFIEDVNEERHTTGVQKKQGLSFFNKLLNRFKDEHIREAIEFSRENEEHGSAFFSLADNEEAIEPAIDSKNEPKSEGFEATKKASAGQELSEADTTEFERENCATAEVEENEVEGSELATQQFTKSSEAIGEKEDTEDEEEIEDTEESEKVLDKKKSAVDNQEDWQEQNLDDLALDDKVLGDKQDQDLKRIVKEGTKQVKLNFAKFKQGLKKQVEENKKKSQARRADFKKANEEIRYELESEHSASLPAEERQKKERLEASDNPHQRLKLKSDEISRRKELLKARISFFVIAMVLLLTPFFYVLIKPQNLYSEGEKRALTLFPKITLDSVLSADFMRDFEKYSNDQFPLRREFLGVNYLMRRGLLNKDNGSVIFGKDSYLFNKTAINDDGQYYQNVSILKDLDEAVGRGDYGNREVYCAIVPNKEVILPDKLPTNTPVRNQDLYQDLIKRICQNINYVDMKSNLLDAEKKARTFYMTDHHWTSYGAFAGTNSIFSSMNLNLLYADRFDKNIVKDDFLGSLIAKSGKISLKKDDIEIWRNKEFESDPNSTLEVRSENNLVLRKGLYEPQALDADSPYDVFAGGEFPFLSFHTSSADDKQGQSILIIKDSFADSTLPFMTQRFAHIYYLDPRYSNLSISDVLAEYPDISKVLILMNFNSFVEEANFGKIIN